MKRLALGLVLLAAVTVHGQTPAPLAFEVASVKPATPPAGPGFFTNPSGRFSMPYASLRMLIGMAYQIQDWNLMNAPAWTQSTFFSINAKMPEGVPLAPPRSGDPPAMMLMLRTLLAERFQLKVHTEKREMQAYRLVLARQDGKLGSNINATQTDCAAVNKERMAMAKAGTPPRPPEFGKPMLCGMQGGPAQVIASSIEIRQLVPMLQAQLRAPVSDRTGLSGTFDLHLAWTPDQLPPRPPGSPADGPIRVGPFTIDPNGPSLMTALQEQLGLKLESVKEMVDVLVVDSVSQPTPD